MVIVIDNYDSFTWNLVQYLWELGAEVRVFKNDQVSTGDILNLGPNHIVISPGPCTPNEAGISVGLIGAASTGRIPILGVCLGHQAIGQAFGGIVERANRLMHGKTSRISHDGDGVFTGLPSPFTATRYHSLVVNDALPPDLIPTAWSTDAHELMGVRHRILPIEGVQFHPESFLTEHGHVMLKNFLVQARKKT